jgi:glycosyltransferase involved in cell wall biosynthesis
VFKNIFAPLKTLFVLPEFYPHPGGGIATYYLHFLPLLAQSGCTVKVLVGSGFTQGEETHYYNGLEIEYLKPQLFTKYRALFKKLDLAPEIHRHLAAAWALYDQAAGGNDYDLVETTDWGYGYVPWVLEKRKPVIVRLHGSCAQIDTVDPRQGFGFWADLSRALETSTLPLADQCITYSPNNRHFWKRRLDLNASYIPPIFNMESADTRTDHSIPQTPYLLVVGRIQNWKGPEILCQALEKASCRYPIYWIGRDTDFQKKKQSYNQYLKQKYPGIWGGKIIPVGHKPHRQVLNWMRQARFGIIPSTWDMFNFTALEWLSLGKPVICSKGAGAWELVDQSQGGALFDAGDANRLAEIISQWSALPDDTIQSVGHAGKCNIRSILNPEQIIQQNLAIYRRLTDQHKTITFKADSNWAHGLWLPENTPSSRQATMQQWPLREITGQIWTRILEKLRGKP